MPACFELISKSSKERERLSTVDEAICAHVGVEPDPKYYYRSWVDTIGLSLACGKDWAWARAWARANYADSPELVAVVDFLEANYTYNAWHER